MAKSPQKLLPNSGGFAQSQTLYLPAPGTLGVLVKLSPKPSSSERKFASAAAALAWCEQERINLVYFFPNESARN